MAANDELSPYLLLVLLLAPPLFVLALQLARAHGRRDADARSTLHRLPPGPWALPVIGHLHHLAGAAPPHRALRDLARRYGPVMSLRLGTLPVVVASSPAAAREVTRTHDLALASRAVAPALRSLYCGAEGVTFAPYGDGWRQMRRACALGLFAAARVRSFRDVREDELGRLLRAVAADAGAGKASAPVNLTRLISRFVSDSEVRDIVGGGIRRERRGELLLTVEAAVKSLTRLSLLDFFPPSSRLATLVSRVARVIERRRRAILSEVPDMDAILSSIIQEHQERRDAAAVAGAGAGVQDDDDDEEDLLDVLLRMQKDMDSQYPLTTRNIKSVIMDMLSAGSETASTTVQWAMMELMRNPSAMRKTQDEVRTAFAGQSKVTEDGLANLRYLRLVIKEALRLYPPAPLLLPRECRSACEVLGHHVPRGAMVLVNAWAIGRDSAHWGGAGAPADEFVPERFEFEHGGGGRDFRGADFEFIPFGAGRRMCPGMAFGLAHVELALAALLFHFDWEMPEGMAAKEMDMTEAAGITMPPRSELVLVAVPRVPVPVD